MRTQLSFGMYLKNFQKTNQNQADFLVFYAILFVYKIIGIFLTQKDKIRVSFYTIISYTNIFSINTSQQIYLLDSLQVK